MDTAPTMIHVTVTYHGDGWSRSWTTDRGDSYTNRLARLRSARTTVRTGRTDDGSRWIEYDTLSTVADLGPSTTRVVWLATPTVRPGPRPAGPCPCECNSGAFCGGCGHRGCGRR